MRAVPRLGVLLAAGFASLMAAVVPAQAQPAGQLPAPQVAPNPVLPGAQLWVTGAGCVPEGSKPAEVDLTVSGGVGTLATEPSADGSWRVMGSLPENALPGSSYTIRAACDTYTSVRQYPEISFTVGQLPQVQSTATCLASGYRVQVDVTWVANSTALVVSTEDRTSGGEPASTGASGRVSWTFDVASAAKLNLHSVYSEVGLDMTFKPAYPSCVASGAVSAVSVMRGETQTVHGSGFASGENVTAVLHSAPMMLGTFKADQDGAVNFTFAVPMDLPLGSHTVTLTGQTSGRTASVEFVVTAASSEGTSEPTTPTSTFTLLPGSTGDVAPPARQGSLGQMLAVFAVLLSGLLTLRTAQRRVRGRHV